MLAACDRSPVWFTEFGWKTAAGTNWHVDERTQAAHLADGFRILRRLPFVRGVLAATPG